MTGVSFWSQSSRYDFVNPGCGGVLTMTWKENLLQKGCLTACITTLSSIWPIILSAHGSFEEPVSRVYGCYLEGPENPISAACQDMVSIGGTQPLYDWNEVNQGDAAGNHRGVIPDGTLCAGGRDKYRGLNQARSDWVDMPVFSSLNGQLEFIYYATAPHASEYFQFYVTRDSHDPNQPLAWTDLEPAFCNVTDVTLDKDQRYRMSCPMPQGKSGKHIIFNIWQRSDSPEAFYACLDVDFGLSSDQSLIFGDSFESQARLGS